MSEIQQWYYAVGEQTLGPVAAAEIETLIQQGVICPSTWVVVEGTENWVLVHESPFADKFQVLSSRFPTESPPSQNLESRRFREGVLTKLRASIRPDHPLRINTVSAIRALATATQRRMIIIREDLDRRVGQKYPAVAKALAVSDYACWRVFRITVKAINKLRVITNPKQTIYDPEDARFQQSTVASGGERTLPNGLRAWSPWITLCLILVFSIMFIKLCWPSHGQHNSRVASAYGPSETDSSVAAFTSSLQSSASNLVVKGLYIGMPKEEAKKNIISVGQGKVMVRPTTHPGEHGYDILLEDPNIPGGRLQGGIWTDSKDDSVKIFFFYTKLSNLLFNTEDQTPAEFAQTFINAYNVPKLTVTTFSGMQCWAYISPHGWTLRIMIDKTVDLSKTPGRNFD